jgi:DNA-directed RNA polymerase subunit omega
MKVIYPSVDEMLKKVDSRYSLAIMAAKRARQLRELASGTGGDTGIFKEVTFALRDIASGKVTFERIKDGIK